MLSIQQLIKALRTLQSSGGTGADLVKSLKQAVGTAASTTTTTAVPPPALVTSSILSPQQHEQTVAGCETTEATAVNDSSQQPQQQQQQQQLLTFEQQQQNFSHISHLNESGLSLSSAAPTAQDSSSKNSKSASLLVAPPSSPSVSSGTFRSQQIQNFYQQQLHHFHTQNAQSTLCAKQKQTQFAMSSLAAEPLVNSDALKNNDSPAAAAGSDNYCNDSATTAEAAEKQQQNSSSSSGRPCFNTGLAEILQFMELIGNLKHTKRTGWVLRDVNDCESISGHMYRMSMMTFLLDGTEGLNQIRCMELALVHDLAESLVGDITPFCGISKEDKRAMEFKAMEDICKLIEPRGKRIMELFEEYEHGESAESKFVKDLDRLDMVMQAFEYEKRDNCLLKHQEFFDSTEGKFQHPFVKKLVTEIYEQRRTLAKVLGATPPPSISVPDWESVAASTKSAASSSTTAINGHCLEQQQHQQKSSSTSTS